MAINTNHGINALTASSGNITVNGSVPQPELVSGTNIKTINSTSLLGSGDISISSSSNGFENHFMLMGG